MGEQQDNLSLGLREDFITDGTAGEVVSSLSWVENKGM